MKVTLHLIDGPEAGKEFEFLEADTFLVGRTSKAHLRFDKSADRLISRNHFFLEIRPPRCIVTDLDSKNGTFVNGRRVKRTELENGDVIRVGKTKIKVAVSLEEKPLPTVLCALCGRDVTDEVRHLPPERLADLSYTCINCEKTSLLQADMDLVGTPLLSAQPVFTCIRCDTDLSLVANKDGLAGGLPGALYMCEKCAFLSREAGIPSFGLDDYIFMDELGSGGMGIVYKAVHRRTNRLCAVKMILPELVRNEYAGRVFEREVMVQSKVAHPNLVRVLDQGLYMNMPYFITEYLSGGDFKQLVTEKFQGPVDPALACRITVQILRGLQVLHEHGFIHRDLKPSNCLLDRPHTEDGVQAKIADYGLAKSFEDAGNSIFDYTEEGVAAGSYVFIPPEQITNYRFVKPPADVYAVGASLYYMLTGTYSVDFPLQEDGDTPARHPVQVVLEDPPVPIMDRNPRLPDALAAVVDKAVVKDEAGRYQTAEAFRTALERVAHRLGWAL